MFLIGLLIVHRLFFIILLQILFIGSRLDTSANHVVAALKYNITRSSSLPSVAKPPLIRPATFLYNSKNTRVENPTQSPPVIYKDDSNADDAVTSRTVCIFTIF